MDAILYNPTNEILTPMCGGKTFVFDPGKKMLLDGPKANHIMNEYGIRGMVQLNYGDDNIKAGDGSGRTLEEQKRDLGIERNMAFKRSQIIKINQMNEARKQEGKKYIEPTPQVKEYAKELGIDLLSPYEAADIKTKEMADIRRENQELRDIVHKQSAQLAKLLDMMGDKTSGEDDGTGDLSDKDVANFELIKKFKNLGANNFENWVTSNMAEIKAWPNEVMDEIRKKWRKLYKDKACPL